MTLILTYLAHDFVVQASDRRLTLLSGEVAEEAANKALLIKPFMIWSFTGLSRLGRHRGQPTDEVLMEGLATQLRRGMEAASNNLARTATRLCRETSLPGLSSTDKAAARRTSFIGAGFTNEGRSRPYRPTLCVVSNAQGRDEIWRPTADREFKVDVAFMPHDFAMHLHVAGQPLEAKERSSLNRLLRAVVGHSV